MHHQVVKVNAVANQEGLPLLCVCTQMHMYTVYCITEMPRRHSYLINRKHYRVLLSLQLVCVDQHEDHIACYISVMCMYIMQYSSYTI